MIGFRSRYFNRAEVTARRKVLRSKPTLAERVLWRHLKSKRMCSFRMRRQYSVGPYVIDFFSAEFRLAIEVDGSGHMADGQRKHDERRTKYLSEFGITVLRFTNVDVLSNTEAVLREIVKAANGLRSHRPQ